MMFNDVPGQLRQGTAGGAHVEGAREGEDDARLVEDDAALVGGVVGDDGPRELVEVDA